MQTHKKTKHNFRLRALRPVPLGRDCAGGDKTMNRAESDLLPHGQFRLDCDFQIGHVKTVDGESIYGIIWYAGGESWCWTSYGQALCHARDSAERQDIARKTGRARSGLELTALQRQALNNPTKQYVDAEPI